MNKLGLTRRPHALHPLRQTGSAHPGRRVELANQRPPSNTRWILRRPHQQQQQYVGGDSGGNGSSYFPTCWPLSSSPCSSDGRRPAARMPFCCLRRRRAPLSRLPPARLPSGLQVRHHAGGDRSINGRDPGVLRDSMIKSSKAEPALPVMIPKHRSLPTGQPKADGFGGPRREKRLRPEGGEEQAAAARGAGAAVHGGGRDSEVRR